MTSDEQNEDLGIIWICPVSDYALGCDYLVDTEVYLETTLEHEQDEQKRYCKVEATDNTGVTHYVSAI